MQQAPAVIIDVPKEERIARLVRDYTGINHELLVEATRRIQKRLGGKDTQRAIDALSQHDYATVADITLSYYDKSYLHGISVRNSANLYTFDASTDLPSLSASRLIHQKLGGKLKISFMYCFWPEN